MDTDLQNVRRRTSAVASAVASAVPLRYLGGTSGGPRWGLRTHPYYSPTRPVKVRRKNHPVTHASTVHTTSTPAAAGEDQSVHLTVNLDTVAFLFSFKGAMQCGANKLPELAPGGALPSGRCSCTRLSPAPAPRSCSAC